MSNCPQDVVEAIMATISPDYSSLSACALVCHSFRLAAQRHIFHTVDLGSSDRCQGLLNLLEQNIGLALYVKKVTFRGEIEEFGFGFIKTPAGNGTTLSWSQSAAGQPLVGLLTNVNYLKLESFDFGVTGPESLSPPYITMDRIEILEVEDCDFTSTRQLVELINLCPRVNTLSLSTLSAHRRSSYDDIQKWTTLSKLGRKEARTRSLEKMNVEYLSDELSDELSAWISDQGLAKSLRTLETYVDIHRIPHIRFVQTILNEAGPCLKTFILRQMLPYSGVDPPPCMLDLAPLSKISLLRLYQFNIHALERIPALLSSVQSANELAKVTITIDISHESERGGALRVWAVIDNIIIQSRFDHMKTVRLEVKYTALEGYPALDEALIRSAMPVADSRGILEIQIDMCWEQEESDEDSDIAIDPFD